MASMDIATNGQTPVAESHDVLILEPLPESGSSSVAFSEVMRVAYDSLVANKVRALLTMLGVIIGVASVVTLLSLGAGATNYITGQVSAQGTNNLTIQPQAAGERGPGSSSAPETLTLADSDAIAALKLPISGPSPQYSTSAQVIAPAADKNTTVVGIKPVYQQINSLTMTSGSFLDESQVQGANNVVVLGSTLAKDLFGSGQAVGQVVRIKSKSFRVIGVLAAKGSGGFGSQDDQAFVPITVAQQQLGGVRALTGSWRVSNITVAANNSSDVDYVQRRVEELLRERHSLKADGTEDDFGVMNLASFLTTLTTITTALTYFLGAIAAISLLVGGIGIMNIMLVSVTERTREIGLRKAVGARGNDILLQFVVEATALSLLGGLIGLALGSIAPLIVTATGLLNAPVTATSAVLGVGFSVAVGLFFGIYPARQAARLNPIEALRHE